MVISSFAIDTAEYSIIVKCSMLYIYGDIGLGTKYLVEQSIFMFAIRP